MKPEDRQRFADALKGVYALYRAEFSQAVLEIWWRALEGYELRDVVDALSKHAMNPDTGMFCPKPADVVKMFGGTTKDQAILAWAKVENAVRSVGPYRTVVFDDPIVHRVIEDLGGWPALCRNDLKEWPFVEKRFLEHYRAHRHKGDMPQHPTRLIGICESTNNFNGYTEHPHAKAAAEPVLIGEPGTCKLIAQGVMLPEPVTALLENRK